MTAVDKRKIDGPHEIGIKRTIRNEIHRIYSPKAEQILVVESSLEADVLFLLESNPKIVNIVAQPQHIPISRPGCHYTCLDFEATYASGRRELIEVKPYDSLKENEEGERVPKNWSEISQWCENNGFVPRVITDKEINPQYMEIYNWRELLGKVRFAKKFPDPVFADEVTDIVEGIGVASVSLIKNHVPRHRFSQVLTQVAAHFHTGALTADLVGRIFTSDCPVRLVGDA